MSETKWTPGPWVYDPDFEPEDEPVIWTAGDIADAVAYLSTSAPNSDEEIVANAHLIAAAPELYEALERAKQCVATHDHAFEESVTEFEALLKCWLKDANAALAKSRGEVSP